MLLICGVTLTLMGGGLVAGGLLDGTGGEAGRVQLVLGFVALQMGATAVLASALLRALDRHVRDNFEKLFVFLAEVPASRRAIDLFSDLPPPPTRTGSGMRTLRWRAAVA